jgi:hypothetical protein
MGNITLRRRSRVVAALALLVALLSACGLSDLMDLSSELERDGFEDVTVTMGSSSEHGDVLDVAVGGHASLEGDLARDRVAEITMRRAPVTALNHELVEDINGSLSGTMQRINEVAARAAEGAGGVTSRGGPPDVHKPPSRSMLSVSRRPDTGLCQFVGTPGSRWPGGARAGRSSLFPTGGPPARPRRGPPVGKTRCLLAFDVGPGPDNRHVTLDHIEQLRELVEARPAQKIPDRRHA